MEGKSNEHSHLKVKPLDFIKQHKNCCHFETKYELFEDIGEGSYGNVFRCKELSTGLEKAVKIMTKNGLGEKGKEALQNEIMSLKEVDHPNIVTFYEFFEDD